MEIKAYLLTKNFCQFLILADGRTVGHLSFGRLVQIYPHVYEMWVFGILFDWCVSLGGIDGQYIPEFVLPGIHSKRDNTTLADSLRSSWGFAPLLSESQSIKAFFVKMLLDHFFVKQVA